MIISGESYHGISRAHLAAFEAAVQGSVTEMYDLSVALWDEISKRKGKKHDFGDADYTIHADTTQSEDYGETLTFQRLRFNNHSGGFWVVLQWRKPHASQKDYAQMVDFWFHGNQGALPRTLSWTKFEADWGLGEEDLHFKGRRLSPEDAWSGWTHTLDFKHPLLAQLRWGLEELKEESNGS